jgi:RHS repeat-associated protein
MGDGLDYFGARYFSGAQGRFTSPDWSTTPQPVPYANLSDPQTLNLYAYARNNPLSRRDPNGHLDIAAACNGQSTCSKTLVQTVNIVHQETNRRTGETQTIVDSTVKITTTFNLATNAKGKLSASAASTVENVSGHEYSAKQLTTMGTNIGLMQQAAVTRGFGQNTTQLVTGIGAAESAFGASPNGTIHAWMNPAINPMQLIKSSGATLDRNHNIMGGMDVLQWAGKPSGYSGGTGERDTYYRYSNHSPETMTNWEDTYSSITEKLQ